MVNITSHAISQKYREGWVAGWYDSLGGDGMRYLDDMLRRGADTADEKSFMEGYRDGSQRRNLDIPPPRPPREKPIRQAILRELAVQSLEATVRLEEHIDLQLVEAAARENITVYELVRERLLLRAGVATMGALATLVGRVSSVDHSRTVDERAQEPDVDNDIASEAA